MRIYTLIEACIFKNSCRGTQDPGWQVIRPPLPLSSPTHSTTHLSSATLTHIHSLNPHLPALQPLQKLFPLLRVSQPSSPLKEFQPVLHQGGLKALLPLPRRISSLHSSFRNLVYLSTTAHTYHLGLASVCTCLCNHFQKEPLRARAQGLHPGIPALWEFNKHLLS